MTLAKRFPPLSNLFFVLPFAVAATSTATAGEQAQPLEAPLPGDAASDGPVPLTARLIQIGKPAESDADSRKAAARKQIEAARKKAARFLTSRKDRHDDRGDAAKMHEHDHHGIDRKGLLTVNVIVTVNVKSGNVFGPAGQPATHDRDDGRRDEALRERDQAIQNLKQIEDRERGEPNRSAGREAVERALREHKAAVDRLQRELGMLQAIEDHEESHEIQERALESRERFEQMRQDARRRFEEIRDRTRDDEDAERSGDIDRQRDERRPDGEPAEQRRREARERWRQDHLRQFEEMRRERDERAREEAIEAAAEAAELEAVKDANDKPADPAPNAEPRSSQAPTPGDNLVEFVTSLFK